MMLLLNRLWKRNRGRLLFPYETPVKAASFGLERTEKTGGTEAKPLLNGRGSGCAGRMASGAVAPGARNHDRADGSTRIVYVSLAPAGRRKGCCRPTKWPDRSVCRKARPRPIRNRGKPRRFRGR